MKANPGTGSHSHECHNYREQLLRILHSCAFYVGPTGEELGPCHWKSRSDRRLLLTRLLYLRCGQSTRQRVSEKSLTSDGPCVHYSGDITHKVSDSTHQTFKNVSSDALISTFPEAESAQQQLLTSSWCASILTVRLLASKSYTSTFLSYLSSYARTRYLPNIFPSPPATTSLPSAENLQLQIPNSLKVVKRLRRVGIGSAKGNGIWIVDESSVVAMCTVESYV